MMYSQASPLRCIRVATSYATCLVLVKIRALARLVAAQDAEQQAQLALAGNVVEFLRNLIHRDPFGGDGDFGGILHVLPRQQLHARGQGGAVEHGNALVACRHLPDQNGAGRE